MARKRPRLDRYTQDALLEANVRFGPQESALAELLAGERSNRITSIKGAEGAAKAATAVAQASREPLRKSYHQAGLTRQEANADADRALAGLGTAADVFRGAVARERANAKTRIAEAQASALRGVDERLGQIALGAQSARTQADARYAGARSQIGRSFVDLARQRGDFTALSVARQREAQRARNAEFKKIAAQIESQTSLQEDEQSFTAGEKQKDRDLKRELDAGKSKKPKVGREKRIENKAQFDKAFAIAKRLRKAGGRAKAPEATIIDFLVTQKDIDSRLARAATRTVIGGGVGPKEFKTIYRVYGIRVPRFKARPKAVRRTSPVRSTAAGVGSSAAQGASGFAR